MAPSYNTITLKVLCITAIKKKKPSKNKTQIKNLI